MLKGFHIHVYFDAASKPQALALRGSIQAAAAKAVLGRVHDDPVAFHPRAMYQVALSVSELGSILEVVMAERGDLSVLVHPLHGNVWVEHTSDAMWLGTPLVLDEEKLREASAS